MDKMLLLLVLATVFVILSRIDTTGLLKTSSEDLDFSYIDNLTGLSNSLMNLFSSIMKLLSKLYLAFDTLNANDADLEDYFKSII